MDCHGGFSKGHSHVLNSLETSVHMCRNFDHCEHLVQIVYIVPTVSASSKPYTLLLTAAH